MSSTIQGDAEDLAIIGRLYKAVSECMILRGQLESKNAELISTASSLDVARTEIEMLKRDIESLKGERSE